LLHPSGDGGFPQIDQTLLNGDGIKPSEAADLGFVVPAGITDYVVTSDEYLLELSERKKKLLQNIQDLMKTSAVDCQLNKYENEDDGLECVVVSGTTSQYAYHPILAKDIANTSTAFRAPAASAAPAAAVPQGPAAAVPQGPAAAVPQGPVKPPTMLSYEIVINKVPYIAVAKLKKGETKPLTYDLYGRGDVNRLKKLGTSIASADGLPTKNVVFE
jgi:hypothetical protein